MIDKLILSDPRIKDDHLGQAVRWGYTQFPNSEILALLVNQAAVISAEEQVRNEDR